MHGGTARHHRQFWRQQPSQYQGMRSVHEQARHKHTHTQRNSAKEEEGGKREVKGLCTREKVHPRRHHSVCIDGCTPRQLCNRFHHQRVARRWCMYLPAKKYFYIMRTSILSLNNETNEQCTPLCTAPAPAPPPAAADTPPTYRVRSVFFGFLAGTAGSAWLG